MFYRRLFALVFEQGLIVGKKPYRFFARFQGVGDTFRGEASP